MIIKGFITNNMKGFFKSISVLSAICTFYAIFVTNPANAAQQNGLQKSYIGAAVGMLDGDAAFGISGRISFGDAPFSIRATSYFADGIGIATGSVTYDLGIAKKTNVYVGIGGAAGNDGITTVSGGGILQAGAETEISKNIVIFGDGSFGDGFNIYKVGVGYSL